MSEPTIPTEEEIADLPHWARVAFGARCARRVQPLFVHAWPEAPQEHVDAIDKACTLAEASAKDPTAASDRDTRITIGSNADFAAQVGFTATSYSRGHAHAGHAANAASYSVSVSVNANANFVAAIANSAANAASDTADHAVAAIRRDFTLLRTLAEREGWDDDTPVPPEVFGPMWPEGSPEGWPADEGADEPHHLKIEIATPEGLDEDESEALNKRVAALFAELSAMHVAMGGTGLKIIDEDSSATLETEPETRSTTPSTAGGVCS